MKLEQLEKEWMEDCDIDAGNLGSAALDIPKLHSKWYRILMEEKRIMYALSIKKGDLELLLESYYLKTLTAEEIAAAGLPPLSDKKILKPDVMKHVQTNKDMVMLNLKIATQSDKVEFVKDILKQVHGRSFIIKDAIQWAMFQAGSR